jgi:hypothetical protein
MNFQKGWELKSGFFVESPFGRVSHITTGVQFSKRLRCGLLYKPGHWLHTDSALKPLCKKCHHDFLHELLFE